MTSRSPSPSIRRGADLRAAGVALTLFGLGGACEDKHVGRPCELGTMPLGGSSGQIATVSSPALECPSRICLLPGAEKDPRSRRRPPPASRAPARRARPTARTPTARTARRATRTTRPTSAAAAGSSASGRRPSAPSPARSSASARDFVSVPHGRLRRSRASATCSVAVALAADLEGVRDVDDVGLPAVVPERHRDDVEAKAVGRGRLRVQVEARRADDARALVRRDRLQGVAVLLAGARAHLDEDAGAAVVGDDVELALGPPPVARDDAQAGLLEERGRQAPPRGGPCPSARPAGPSPWTVAARLRRGFGRGVGGAAAAAAAAAAALAACAASSSPLFSPLMRAALPCSSRR